MYEQRFYIDTDDGIAACEDEEGLVLPGTQKARQMALTALAEMSADIKSTGDHRVFSATVRDSAGQEIYRAKLTLEAEWSS